MTPIYYYLWSIAPVEHDARGAKAAALGLERQLGLGLGSALQLGLQSRVTNRVTIRVSGSQHLT